MVDIGLDVDVGGIAASAVDSFVSIILWTLLGIAVIAIVVLGMWFFSYKHKVRVRKVYSNGRSIVIDDRARVSKGRDGSIWWKTLKTGISTTEPPVEAREVGVKGKIVSEGYLLSDGRFVWRNNDFDYEKLKNTSADFVKGGYDALTSDERAMYVHQLRESEKYRKKKITDLLAVAAPYIAIIMIFSLFLIFFGEVVTPAKELGSEVRAASSDMKEAMRLLKDIVQNTETIGLDNVSGGVAPN
jgi:hypothetical protein